MISEEEIKKLADLARIEIDDNGAAALSGEIGQILEYVDQVKEIAGRVEDELAIGPVANVWREDADPTPSGTYSKELIAEFPDKEGDYLKVKKIL